MSLLTEFREFAIKGNAFDLAVGVIIGAAFGKIVDSLVKDVIMPPLGLLLGGINFNPDCPLGGLAAYTSPGGRFSASLPPRFAPIVLAMGLARVAKSARKSPRHHLVS